MEQDNYRFIKIYILVVLAVFALVALFSCKTQYVPVETVRTEYKVKTDTFIKKDSVHVKDSVFMHSKGDTVWYEKWHTRYIDRWKEVIKCDTLVKTDSIQVPYPVERELSRWEKFCLDFGKVTTGGCILGIIIAVLWFVQWIRRKRIL